MSERISPPPVILSKPLWRLLLALAARRRAGTLPKGPVGLWWTAGAADDADAAPALVEGAADDARAQLLREAGGRLVAAVALAAAERAAIEPYLPMLAAEPDAARRPAGPFVVAHLGQSIDGCVATASGDSHTVTGEEDFVHMHRLRALSDAVVVGAGTVAADDPRLTTRLVDGPDPVRVVIDPDGRLDPEHGLFVDGAAPTLWVRRATAGAGMPAAGPAPDLAARVERIEIVARGEGDFLPAVLDALGARGLGVLMLEGGGVTVSRWLEAGLLDRLQIAVAPVIIGRGRPGLQLPSAPSMSAARRPPCRLYRLGDDVLWDFDLRGG